MEPVYPQIVDTNWADRNLLPESIPHLFHYDLAYLWMLEKEPERRPKGWQERIEGWHLLTTMFLLGLLDVEEERIREPLAGFTRPFGIDTVAWLHPRSVKARTRIGVLSPTVLVRPLPDFMSTELAAWRRLAEPPTGDRVSRELRHFAHVAVRDLRTGVQDESSYPARLARILEGAFRPELMAEPPAGKHQPVSILRTLGWAQPKDATTAPQLVNLLIRDASGDGDRQVYVPRCRECNDLLTRRDADEAITVTGPSVNLRCGKEHENEGDLADFLIWWASAGRVVVWRDEQQVTLPKGRPPSRTIEGIEVRMEWDPGRVNGDVRRVLRLQFPGATLEMRRLDEVFFDKLLVAGRFESFCGTPVRPEWSDAVQDWGVVDPDKKAPRVTFKGLQLGGWPVPIPRVLGGLSLERREDLAVGLYPNPHDLGTDWRWYRMFADGPDRRGFLLEVRNGIRPLPWLVETRDGLPGHVSVRSSTDPNLGVTYPPSSFAAQVSSYDRSTRDVYIGVDFGTTNTLVTFHRGDPGQEGSVPVNAADLVHHTAWMARPVRDDWAGPIGDFLPPRRYRAGTSDPALIPSAIWRSPVERIPLVIRWGEWPPRLSIEPPSAGVEPLGGFKWDPGRSPGQYKREREHYLREVLLLTLPVILKDLSSHRPPNVKLGFAFPLAFDAAARRGMRDTLQAVARDCGELTGLRFDSVHLSESLACVNAFGVHRTGDVFLVADMGGGTMDVALFRFENRRPLLIQIGSVRFAGEQFVSALGRRKKVQADAALWEVRDLIAQEGALARYGDDQDARVILRRFAVIAAEFLRTMVAAFRQQPGHETQEINLVLVGNGWHLADAFHKRASSVGRLVFFREYYEELLSALGDPHIKLYMGDPLPDLPTSKHLVVRGALQNVLLAQLRELEDKEVQLSKLPAGRAMLFDSKTQPPVRIEWHQVVGDDPGAKIETGGLALSASDLDLDLQAVPLLAQTWRRQLTDAFQVADERQLPYPDIPQLREQVALGIEGNRVSKGPLQLIIEGTWSKKLGD